MSGMDVCPHCGKTTPSDAQMCQWCHKRVHDEGRLGYATPVSEGHSSPSARYGSAYLVCRSLISWGGTLKTLGIIIGVVGTLAGLIVGMGLGESGILPSLVVGALRGLGVGGQLFAQGILISAQGQLLLAGLDTAVHTSPFMTDSDKRAMLGR